MISQCSQGIWKIKKADKISAWLEATLIAGFSIDEANKFFGVPPDEFFNYQELVLRQPMVVKSKFIEKFEELLHLIII